MAIEPNKQYKGYLGNPYLKRPFEQIEFTKEQIQEIYKCKKDLFYFVNNYVHIEIPGLGIKSIKEVGLWPRQVDMLKNLRDNRWNIFKIPRQSAKTTTIAIYYAWCAIFNESEKIGILANKAKLANEIVDKFKVIIEKLPLYMQQGITEYNKGNIALENGSEIKAEATSADPFRGFTLTKCLMDELSFVDYDLADKIYESLYPTLSRAENSQLAIASTPKGINNLFYKIWMDAISNKNDFVPLEIKWYEVPRKDQEKFKIQTIRNIGMTRWRQEYLCEFLAQSNSLISPDAIERIVRLEPIEIRGDFRKFQEPVSDVKDKKGLIVHKGKKYVITVDSSEGVGGDNSALVIFNVSDFPYQVAGTYKNNLVNPSMYAAMVVELARYYNNAHLLIENNSIGYAVAESIIQEYEYDNIIYIKTQNGIERVTGGFGKNASNCLKTTVKTKALGCSALKNLIESGDLHVNDENIFKELVSFVAVGKSFEASEGSTDDLAMCLVMFGWLSRQDIFQELINDTYSSFFDAEEEIIDTPQKMLIKHYEPQEKKEVEAIEKEENILPFGYMTSLNDNEEFDFDW